MDLRLFGQVIWRFRLIFAIGLFMAVVLAGLSMVRVQSNGGVHLTYRQSQVYQSDVRLSVNNARWIWGVGQLPPDEVDTPAWLTQLASTYAVLAQGDAVQRRIQVGGTERLVTAAQLTDASGRNGLPFITVSGASTSASDAVRTAHLGAEILMQTVQQEQNTRRIPVGERAFLRIVQDAGPPTVVQPRKKTVPIFIFLVVLIATIGLIMVLENMRPKPSQTAVPLRGDKSAGADDPEKKQSAGSGDAS